MTTLMPTAVMAIRPVVPLQGAVPCDPSAVMYAYAWQRARQLAAQAARSRFDPRRN